MRSFKVRLPEQTLARLRAQSRETGRSVSALIRDRLDGVSSTGFKSVYDLAADLAGSLAGSGRSATNDRPRFR